MLLKSFIVATLADLVEVRPDASVEVEFDIPVAPVLNNEEVKYEIRVIDPERFPHASRIKFKVTI